MAERTLRIALAQYPIERHVSFDAWRDKLARWFAEAAGSGARLVVFPEYASMELSSLLPEALAADLPGQLAAMQAFLPDFLAHHDRLARRHGLVCVAGSFPVRRAGLFRNTAHVFGPEGPMGLQEKLIMTRFERELWGVSAGEGVRVFEAPFGRFAVAVCYDVEFPLIARAQVEAGAELVLAPSCTDSMRGYHRVRVGAQARALENQCYVAMAPTVGEAPWSPAVDVNVGRAAAFGPPDRGFPEDGVVAEGVLDAAQWLVADLDLSAVEAVRREGQVLNFRHWSEQSGLRAGVEA